MSAFAALTLVNNAAANVTFNPLALNASTGVASYATNNAVYDQKSVASLSVTLPSAKSARCKVKGKVIIPIMDIVNTSLKTDEVIGYFEFVLPKTASQTQRLDIRKYLDTMITNAIVTAAVDNFEGIY